MELNITELNGYDYDQIPENKPIKIIKKNATATTTTNTTATTNKNNVLGTKQPPKSILKKAASEVKPKVSYDDILSKMGMFVANGQLHLSENGQQQKQQPPIQKQKQLAQKQPAQPVNVNAPIQNSYIYNKYFSNEMQNVETGPRVPKNLQEYKSMLIHDIVQKQKIKQIKSTKLIMPNSNINFSPYSSKNLNKLFSFSNR
jgi:hypothetical protein